MIKGYPRPQNVGSPIAFKVEELALLTHNAKLYLEYCHNETPIMYHTVATDEIWS